MYEVYAYQCLVYVRIWGGRDQCRQGPQERRAYLTGIYVVYIYIVTYITDNTHTRCSRHIYTHNACIHTAYTHYTHTYMRITYKIINTDYIYILYSTYTYLQFTYYIYTCTHRPIAHSPQCSNYR